MLLEARGASLEAEWAPRTVNEEADALTNGDTSGFSAALRVDVDVSALDFKVLPRLQDEAALYYEELAAVRRSRRDNPAAWPKKGRARTKLRDSDPW